MTKWVMPPEPTEEKIFSMVAREITFPDGRIAKMKMSEWHWEMVEFVDIWNEHYQREQGIMYEFAKIRPDATDQDLADTAMRILRNDYAEWEAAVPKGKPIRFRDPRK